MSSSGTTADPEVFMRYKPKRGRTEVLVIGKMRIKSSAEVEAGDLTLRTIKTFNLTQYANQDQAGAASMIYGSITTPGSIMNKVSLRVYRGTIYPHTGTQHVGTIAGGTQQLSYIIVGG